MLRYLLRRLISGIIVLFVFISLVFFAVQTILPGDYVSQFAMSLSSKEAAELRRQLGLDLPLGQRYLDWLGKLARGDLGRSYSLRGSGPTVIETIRATLPATLLVFGLGTAIAFLFGLWLGKVAAWRGPGLLTSTITFGSIALYTSFPPWLVFLLTYFLVQKLGLVPPHSLQARVRELEFLPEDIMTQMVFGLVAWASLLLIANALLYRWRRLRLPGWAIILLVVVCWVGSWWLAGIGVYAWNILLQAALPLLAYTLLSFGEIMVIMRTTMADTLYDDYVQTARAKGLPERVVRDRHAARNALLPVISRLVINLPYLLTGMVMVEEVLDWPGLGSSLFFAVGMQNVPLMMGLALVIGVVSLAARLFLDILQALLDPRLRSRAEFSGRAL